MKLTDDMLIGKGSERECYMHPKDKTKVIKIQISNTTNRNQNNLDRYYYEYLATKSISYKHIAKFYGVVDTDKGVGLVFENILNHDDKNSLMLETIIKDRLLSHDVLSGLLLELKEYLAHYHILFIDTVMDNILCQETQKGVFKLVIIDGLGARRFGLKLWLHIHCRVWTYFKIRQKWHKLLFDYNELKNSIDS